MKLKRILSFVFLCLTVLSLTAGSLSYVTDRADIASSLTASWDYEKYIRTVTGLTVTTQPIKTSYVHGETFDPTGMVITASFDDPGPTRDVAGAGVTVSPATLSYDTTSVTVGYEGATTSVPVAVDRINAGAPPSQSGSLTYTGAAQSPAWTAYDGTKMTPAAASGVNAGSYNATFSLAQPYYRWSDGSTAAKAVAWSIGKATPTASVNKTSLSLTSSAPTGSVVVTTNSDGAVTATSANTGVATVSVSGKTVTVTGVASGSTTVTIALAAGTNYNAKNVATVTVGVEIFSNPYLSGDIVLGSEVTFAGYQWIVQHIEGNYAYLALARVTGLGRYKWGYWLGAGANTYADSDLVAYPRGLQNSLSEDVLSYCADVTVNGVTSKIFIPSREQLVSQWAWPKQGNSYRMVRGSDGGYILYWTSTPSGPCDEGGAWYVNNSGTLSGLRYAQELGIRYACKVRFQ